MRTFSGDSRVNLNMDTLTKAELNLENLRSKDTMEQEICLSN